MGALPAYPYELNARQRAILERLEHHDRVLVSELAEALDVSDVTIRKDLQELEGYSLLKRVHGGAVAEKRAKYNLAIGDKLGRLGLVKTRIAEAALPFIHDGDTLILDAGSTTLALARLLPGRKRGLTIVTNALPIIAEMANVADFELISLGGAVRKHSLALIGPLTVASLEKLHADTAFLGATGATAERGLSTPNIVEAETKAALIRAAGKRIVLMDHSKIGRASLAPFAAWTACDCLITDEPLPPDFAESLAGKRRKGRGRRKDGLTAPPLPAGQRERSACPRQVRAGLLIFGYADGCCCLWQSALDQSGRQPSG